MKETLYLNNDLAIVNFSAGYATTGDQLLNSSTFSNYVHNFIDYLKENGVQAVFHYIPLHTAPAGQRFGRFHGEDVYTTKESERLMRLPMYYGLKEEEVRYVASKIIEFYSR